MNDDSWIAVETSVNQMFLTGETNNLLLCRELAMIQSFVGWWSMHNNFNEYKSLVNIDNIVVISKIIYQVADQ